MTVKSNVFDPLSVKLDFSSSASEIQRLLPSDVEAQDVWAPEKMEVVVSEDGIHASYPGSDGMVKLDRKVIGIDPGQDTMYMDGAVRVLSVRKVESVNTFDRSTDCLASGVRTRNVQR